METRRQKSLAAQATWATLPQEILTEITKLSDSVEAKTMRLVCKWWAACVQRNLDSLKPRCSNVSGLEDRVLQAFPGVKTLILEQPVTSVPALEKLFSATQLTCLELGVTCACCPCNGDAQMLQVARMTNLQSFTVENARAITDDGLRGLSALTALRDLNLVNADSIRGAGLSPLLHAHHLRELDLGCCSNLMLEGISAIVSLSRLTRLVLWGVRTDQGAICDDDDPQVSMLTALTGLRYLDLCQSIVPSKGMLELVAGLTQLTCLSLEFFPAHAWFGGAQPQAIQCCALHSLRDLKRLNLMHWPLLFWPASSHWTAATDLRAPPLTHLACTDPCQAPQWGAGEYESVTDGVECTYFFEAVAMSGCLQELCVLTLGAAYQWNSQFQIDQHLSSLTSLTVHGDSWDRGCVSWLSSVACLKELILERPLHLQQPMMLETCTALRRLHLTRVLDLSDEDLLRLTILTQLSSLRLTVETREQGGVMERTSKGVTDKGAACIGIHLIALQALDLEGSQVSSRGVNALSGLTLLRNLRLASTKVGDAGMRAVAGFRHLRALDLEDTMVSDTGLAQLRTLTALLELVVSDCPGVTDRGIQSLACLTRHSLANICAHGCPEVHKEVRHGLVACRLLC